MLGQEIKEYLIFSFDDGKPSPWPIANGMLVSECGTVSPFIEVMKR
jgi:hypothetical protein